MKFGKQLDEERRSLPSDWAAACIEYKTLKSHIKRQIKPNTLQFHADPSLQTWGPSESNPTPFADFVKQRLSAFETAVPEFLRLLDQNIDRLVAFYVAETGRLSQKFGAGVDGSKLEDQEVVEGLLQEVIKLERFVLLNYTGIVKIMKKFDRHSGLHLQEAYIYRLTDLPFYRYKTLDQIKRRLLDSMSGTPATNGIPAVGDVTNPQQTVPGMSLPPAPEPNKPRGSWFPPASVGPQSKVLVSMSGPHGTDIIGAVLENMAKHNCVVEDFVLSRLYHNVTFGCLITLNSDNVDIFRDLAASARKWEATLFFDVQDSKESPVKSLEDAPYQNRTKYTATVLNQNGLTPQFLQDWTRLLLDERISVEKMTRLSASGAKLCSIDFRLSVPDDVDFDKFRASLFQMTGAHHTDVALQPNDVFRKNKRLVIFDMDSTLIQQEVIDEIAKHAGVVGEVAKITEAAMNGEIDFKESLRRRVGLLKGTPVDVLQTVKSQLTFTEGAHFLCRALKRLGFKLAVISGGFMPLALYVKAELGLDYAFANQLRVSPDGKTLTGETVGPIVDGHRKAELLEVIAQAESVTPEQVIAVGDGANDLWMLAAAGLGIAFNAKPKVQKEAPARINQTSLRNVLYLLGCTDEDAKQLAESV
ncbi:hypothetical protein HK097_000843 [Rhizophlyctis rosea]|uniref:phosphoserine phosphatase n=1 Tax=Rhizophlyctis rosea TaxID=64517 RepID=A0AAD5S7Y2_9FUNG|nr:hypothetical protein HK097_000843 [Rhizophlyctis rosea]